MVLHYNMLSKNLKADREIVLVAVTNCKYALKYASKNLKADREIVLAAVTKHGSALYYASENLKADCEIVLIAVSDYSFALIYANASLYKDSIFIRKLRLINNLSIPLKMYAYYTKILSLHLFSTIIDDLLILSN